MPCINNISSELESLSQHVAELPKNTPFTEPKDYFDQLPARLMEAIHNQTSEQELIELPALLKALQH